MARAKYRFSLTELGKRKYERKYFRLVVDPTASKAFYQLYPDVALTNPELAATLDTTTMRASGITSTYCRKGYMKREKIES
jgi:hypothetical protein